MPVPARKPVTWADIEDVIDVKPYPEILDGELSYKPEAGGWHSHAQGEIWGGLAPARAHGGGSGGSAWWILIEPPIVLGPEVLVRPDLAGWRLSTLPEPPRGPLHVRPDWVCEILSPGHGRRDRRDKPLIYARAGVPAYWIVDPDERLIEAFALRGDLYTRLGCWTGDDESVRIPPFDFDLDPRRFFLPGPIRVGEPAEPTYG